MQHSTLVHEIREFVAQSFAAHGMDPRELRETILIRGGCYCGRRFESSNGYAVWFCEENQLKIFNCQGTLLEVVNGLQQRCHSRPLAA